MRWKNHGSFWNTGQIRECLDKIVCVSDFPHPMCLWKTVGKTPENRILPNFFATSATFSTISDFFFSTRRNPIEIGIFWFFSASRLSNYTSLLHRFPTGVEKVVENCFFGVERGKNTEKMQVIPKFPFLARSCRPQRPSRTVLFGRRCCRMPSRLRGRGRQRSCRCSDRTFRSTHG